MSTDFAHDTQTRHKTQRDEEGGDDEEDNGHDQDLGAMVVHAERSELAEALTRRREMIPRWRIHGGGGAGVTRATIEATERNKRRQTKFPPDQ